MNNYYTVINSEIINYFNNLDEKTKDIIKKYTKDDYKDLNDNVRQHLTLSKSQQLLYDTLIKTFKNAPHLTNDIQVFRGIKKKEHIFTDSPISTSLSLDITKTFAGCCIMYIKVCVGIKILPLYLNSEIPSEYEILLEPGGNMNMYNIENINEYDDIVLNENYARIYCNYIPSFSINLNNTSISDNIINFNKRKMISEISDEMINNYITKQLQIEYEEESDDELKIDITNENEIYKMIKILWNNYIKTHNINNKLTPDIYKTISKNFINNIK